MSSALALKEEDLLKYLACRTHIGANNIDYQMDQYKYTRCANGQYLINLKKTWEKLLLAARAIVSIENPADVCVISSRPLGQRAVLKYAAHTGATPIAGRYTPGTFTNQIQAAYREPRLLVVTDPRVDHQPLTEASYVNIPVIAFCNTDSPLTYVDIAIPCNNKAPHSIGLMWWMLAREVLRLRGTISRELKWDVMVDMFFYRDPDETEKEEPVVEQVVERPKEAAEPWTSAGAGDGAPDVHDWGAETIAPAVPPADVAAAPAAPVAATAAGGGYTATPQVDDWATTDWSSSVPQDTWGGSADNWNN